MSFKKRALSELYADCRISLVYGVISIVSGILGVMVGAVLGVKLRDRYPSAG